MKTQILISGQSCPMCKIQDIDRTVELQAARNCRKSEKSPAVRYPDNKMIEIRGGWFVNGVELHTI